MFSTHVSEAVGVLGLAALSFACSGCSRLNQGPNIQISYGQEGQEVFYIKSQPTDVRLLAPQGKKFLLAETGDPRRVVIEALVDSSYDTGANAAGSEILFTCQNTAQPDIDVSIQFPCVVAPSYKDYCLNITIRPKTNK